MWLAAELVVVAWILGGGWLVLRRGPADGSSGILGSVIAYLAAAVSLWLADRCLSLLHANLWMRGAASVAAGMIASGIVWIWWFRSARAPSPRLGRWLRARMPLSCAGLVLAGIALTWTALHAAAWTMILNMAAAGSPDQARAIRRQTLVSSALLGARFADPDAPDPAAARSEAQAHALGRMRQGFTRGVDGVLDASGTGRVMDAMDALRALMRLDEEQRGRLAETIPEIQRLMADPLVLAIIDDQRLMDLVRDAGGGSLTSIYALGDEPRIQALVEDPGMRAAVAAVDLPSIRDRLRRQERTTLAPLRWELATIATSLELDRRLAEPDDWLSSTSSVLVWPTGRRFVLARTGIPAASAVRDLRLRGAGDVSCWIDGAAFPPRREGLVRVVSLPTRGGVLVLMLDAGGAASTCACAVEITEAAATP